MNKSFYSKIVKFKPSNKPKRKGFVLGMAIPCHVNDREYLKFCLHAIKNLNPQPHHILVHFNSGGTLKEAREVLFDKLIEKNCDVIFQNSVDFYLFPNILKYVKRDRVSSFAPLDGKRHDLTLSFLRLLFRNGWSGCYSMPKEYWLNIFKPIFDGSDSSIWRTIGRYNYYFRNTFSYRVLRPYQDSTTKKLLKTFPLWKKLKWQILRLKVVR